MKSILNIPQKSGIYIITNHITGDNYIGSSVNLQKRCNAHKSCLNRGMHCNQIIQRSYLKYGKEAFSFKVLEFVVETDKLINAEQYWIDKLEPAFNIRIIAENNLGLTVSETTKEKMSTSKKGKPLSAARLVAMAVLHKNRIGKKVEGKVKESLKLGPLSLIGKPKSDATKELIRQSKIGKKFNKITRKFE